MIYRPEQVVWEITFRCNVDCLHCGSDCTLDTRQDELSTGEALNVIGQLAELGTQRITISGGEPFTRKDWPILSHRIKQFGMELAYISNGVLITPKVIELLKEIQPTAVGVSLDGGCAEIHDYIRGYDGCFEKAIRAIDMLLDAGFYTSIVTSVQRINFFELEKIKRILLLLGADAWQIQIATPQGRMQKTMAVSERQFYEISNFIAKNNQRYKRFYISGADCFGYFGKVDKYLHPSGWHGCHAGMRVLGLESNGNIKGCLSLPGHKFVEGNIREKSIRELWEDPDKFKFNRQFDKSMLDGYCAKCTYGDLCRGGCTERSFGFSSDYCDNSHCNYKIETVGFTDEVQASLNPEPEVTQEFYNNMRPLPEGFSFVGLEERLNGGQTIL